MRGRGEGTHTPVSQYKERAGLGQEEDIIQLPSVPVRRPREPGVTVGPGCIEHGCHTKGIPIIFNTLHRLAVLNSPSHF